MKKRFLVILLAALLVVGMCACGDNKDGDNTPDTKDTVNTETVEAPDTDTDPVESDDETTPVSDTDAVEDTAEDTAENTAEGTESVDGTDTEPAETDLAE